MPRMQPLQPLHKEVNLILEVEEVELVRILYKEEMEVQALSL